MLFNIQTCAHVKRGQDGRGIMQGGALPAACPLNKRLCLREFASYSAPRPAVVRRACSGCHLGEADDGAALLADGLVVTAAGRTAGWTAGRTAIDPRQTGYANCTRIAAW